MIVLLTLAAVLVAYANGANDNFKGVATLYGGGIASYRLALSWSIITTFLGSLTSYFLGRRLLQLFSGNGIVAEAMVRNPQFLACVALAAACVVVIATFIGMPVSTTHALIGGLTGAAAAGHGLISLKALGSSFLLPLITGPVIATGITYSLYLIMARFRKSMELESEHCVCVTENQETIVTSSGLLAIRATGIGLKLDEESNCADGSGVKVKKLMDAMHGLSAGAVSFARGLNDTPKVAALLLLAPFLSGKLSILTVGAAIGAGALFHSQKIAQRMSFDLTEMNPGQAFTGNFVTALLVVTGSLLGFPLSTTHVSCGAIFGIGLANRRANIRCIASILLAWLITLPLAALFSAILWRFFALL